MRMNLLPLAVAVLGMLVGGLSPTPGVAAPGDGLDSTTIVPLGDGRARAHLEGMERDGVLRDPIWAHAFWVRSRNAPSASERVADLRWALRFDPELNEARWELAGVMLTQRNPEFATHVVDAVTRGVRSFPGQHRMLVWILTLALGTVAFTLTVLSLLTLAKTLPRIHHGIRERLHFLPIEIRSGATLLSLALPLVLAATLAPTAALFWTLLLGTVGAWTLLDRWERRTCLAALTLVLLSPLALAGWSRIVETGHSTSYVQSLWATQTSDDAREARVRALSAGDADGHYWSSLALVERRRGNFEAAAQNLKRAIALAPDEWALWNNLGNVQLLAGEANDALASYQSARALAPEEPLIRVNEAQAWVQKLEFARADQALSDATRLGYHLPPMLNSGGTDVIVRDRTLSSAALWSEFAHADAGHGGVSWARVGSMMGSLLFPVSPVWMSLPFFVAIWYVSLARFLPRGFHCSSCGKAICRKCHYRIMRRSLCSHCYVIRQDVQAPLRRQELLEERRRRATRWGRILTVASSLLVPGIGYTSRGLRRRGVTLMVLTALVYLAATADVLWPDPSVAGGNSHPRLPLLLLGLAYLGLVSISIRGYLKTPPPSEHEASHKPPAPGVV